MNALNIYLQTCRYVISADVDDRHTWEEIYKFIPYLRESLSCYVCKNIAKNPMGRGYQVCQHFVCEDCIGGKMRLKPQCSWCKEYVDFHLLTDLQHVAYCFKKLCVYIQGTPLVKDIEAQAALGLDNDLKIILEEGCNYDDPVCESAPPLILPPTFSSLTVPTAIPTKQVKEETYSHYLSSKESEDVSSDDLPHGFPKLSVAKTKVNSSRCIHGTSKDSICSKIEESISDFCTHSDHSYGSVDGQIDIVPRPSIHVDKEPQTKHRKIHKNFVLNEKSSDSDTSAEIDILGMPTLTASISAHTNNLRSSPAGEVTVKIPHKMSKTKCQNQSNLKRQKGGVKIKADTNGYKLCKCGRGGTNSRLTCLGQRCPCYINKLPCVGCKCQGCRNPRKSFENSTNVAMASLKQEVKGYADQNKCSEQFDCKGV